MSDVTKIDCASWFYNCAQCSHQAAFVFQLDFHMHRKHRNVCHAELCQAIAEPEQFSCICCDYKSYHRLILYEHYKQAHGATDKRNESFRKEFEYPCHQCGHRSNSSLSLLKYHNLCKSTIQVSNEKIDASKCRLCSYRANRKSYLKHHMLTHARDDEIAWFHCNYCSYRTKYKQQVNVHMLYKHVANEEISWFQCGICSYRSKVKAALNRHCLLRHASNDDIDWFRCQNCSFHKSAI